MTKIIQTNDAPAAIGPYSQGVAFHHLVFTAGQLPIDPKTSQISDSIEEQTHQALSNCKAVLEAAGSGLDHVLKVTVFIRNMEDFGSINQVYKTYFKEGNYPARSVVEVSRLPKDAWIEIEMVGTIPEPK